MEPCGSDTSLDALLRNGEKQLAGPIFSEGLTRELTPASVLPGWELDGTVMAEDIPTDSSDEEESTEEVSGALGNPKGRPSNSAPNSKYGPDVKIAIGTVL